MKDLLGSFCSGICIVHCLLVPLLVVFGISIAGVSLLESERIHIALTLPIIVFSLWSLPQGWKTYQQWPPIIFGSITVLLILISLFAEEALVPYLAVTAGLLLIAAHLLNRNLTRYKGPQCT